MAEEENVNEETQDESSGTPEDRPVFNPEMIVENAMIDPDVSIPEDDLGGYIEESEE